MSCASRLPAPSSLRTSTGRMKRPWDTLRFLVRRIAQLPVVLLLTYRDDELSRDHPLTQLLGDASHAEQVHHLSPQRLTEPAVRELVAGRSLDVDEVYALSDGNPYFVSELVASAIGSSIWGEAGCCAGIRRSSLHEILRLATAEVPKRMGTTITARLGDHSLRLSDGSMEHYDVLGG